MMEKNALLDKLKEIASRGSALALKATPLWMEAIGVGAFISTIVQKNPGLRERLSGLDGKVFLFEARDIGKKFYLHIKAGDIKVLVHTARAPDVIMRGEVSVLFGVFTGRVDPDTVFFSRRLEIQGDTASAIYLKNTLAALS